MPRHAWYVRCVLVHSNGAHGHHQVFFDATTLGISFSELVERAAQLPEPITLGGSRLVVHIQTSDAAVDDLLDLVRTLAEEKKAAGFVPAEATTNGTSSNIYVKVKPAQAQ